jgi:hypothetical protein
LRTYINQFYPSIFPTTLAWLMLQAAITEQSAGAQPESIATLPLFGTKERHKWFFQISSQWESQKNRFAFISFGKIQFLPPCIWYLPFMSYRLRKTTRVNYSFDTCLPCVIKLMMVFCVHSVLHQQQQQLVLSEARSWAAPDKGKTRGTVRQGRRHGPSITTQISPAGSLLPSQPGRPPCRVISLVFGLIVPSYGQ